MNKLSLCEIQQCKEELKAIEASIAEQGPFDVVTPYLIRYAVIRACSSIEICLKEVICGYFLRSRIQQVQEYLNNTIRSRSFSPKIENIYKVLNRFDRTWRDNLKELLLQNQEGEKIKDSVTSLANIRDSFAHGNFSVQITIQQAIDYHNDATKMLETMYKVMHRKGA